MDGEPDTGLSAAAGRFATVPAPGPETAWRGLSKKQILPSVGKSLLVGVIVGLLSLTGGLGPLALIVMLIFFVLVLWSDFLSLNGFRWALGPDGIHYRFMASFKGIPFSRTRFAPYPGIVHVHKKQGPLQKMAGVATIIIVSPGLTRFPTAIQPPDLIGVAVEDADEIIEEIVARLPLKPGADSVLVQ